MKTCTAFSLLLSTVLVAVSISGNAGVEARSSVQGRGRSFSRRSKNALDSSADKTAEHGVGCSLMPTNGVWYRGQAGNWEETASPCGEQYDALSSTSAADVPEWAKAYASFMKAADGRMFRIDRKGQWSMLGDDASEWSPIDAVCKRLTSKQSDSSIDKRKGDALDDGDDALDAPALRDEPENQPQVINDRYSQKRGEQQADRNDYVDLYPESDELSYPYSGDFEDQDLTQVTPVTPAHSQVDKSKSKSDDKDGSDAPDTASPGFRFGYGLGMATGAAKDAAKDLGHNVHEKWDEGKDKVDDKWHEGKDKAKTKVEKTKDFFDYIVKLPGRAKDAVKNDYKAQTGQSAKKQDHDSESQVAKGDADKEVEGGAEEKVGGDADKKDEGDKKDDESDKKVAGDEVQQQ
ncbi:uncharacterized protein PFL1_01774 [Pseudozyma flocculosa PF-1]|uniref:Uncharacterized protein n=1 Tax=Pseudozyma flocculosa TaxID=84751 RepID=A0A5C3EZA2_9BASI|nr:uncharacterized protein PFL1_01774 [Pseudozyma flocculosa PF-1]EPQ30877.1 hypothetical protein PFL1_01774 [Pseudozyma flocculosa PF-1]SPO36747.1 uncharacterized protein PSFLO_02218 [Pseudozyma flocculosa]